MSYISESHLFTIIDAGNCSFSLRNDVVVQDIVGEQTNIYRKGLVAKGVGLINNVVIYIFN